MHLLPAGIFLALAVLETARDGFLDALPLYGATGALVVSVLEGRQSYAAGYHRGSWDTRRGIIEPDPRPEDSWGQR